MEIGFWRLCLKSTNDGDCWMIHFQGWFSNGIIIFKISYIIAMKWNISFSNRFLIRQNLIQTRKNLTFEKFAQPWNQHVWIKISQTSDNEQWKFSTLSYWLEPKCSLQKLPTALKFRAQIIWSSINQSTQTVQLLYSKFQNKKIFR